MLMRFVFLQLAVILFAVAQKEAHAQDPVRAPVRVRDVNDTRWNEGPLDSKAVDWSLFPKGYGILSSERLMSPVDLQDWPAKVGKERQLFLDNVLVAAAANVKRTVHQPAKFPGNPIFTGQEPWEKDKNVIVLQVLRDAATGKFRMWYTTYRTYILPQSGLKGRSPTLYAESPD